MIGLRDQDAHVFIQMGILVTIRGVDAQYTGVKMSAGTGKTYGKNLFRRGTEIVPVCGQFPWELLLCPVDRAGQTEFYIIIS